MDLSRARIVLRERSTLDVLDLALRFVVAHKGAYAKVTGVAVVPALLVSWGLASRAGWAWGWIAAIPLALLAQTPFTVLASRLVFEPDVRLRDVIGASLRSLPRLFVLRILQLLLLGAGLFTFVAARSSGEVAVVVLVSILAFALILPGLAIDVALLFVSEAAILERATLGATISRSRRLLRGHSGQAIAAALALFLLHVAATLLGDDVGRFVVGSLFQFGEPAALWTAGGSPLALAGFWLFLPYAATARFFVYLDLRTRSEGWDIQTRFAAIALRAQEKRAAA